MAFIIIIIIILSGTCHLNYANLSKHLSWRVYFLNTLIISFTLIIYICLASSSALNITMTNLYVNHFIRYKLAVCTNYILAVVYLKFSDIITHNAQQISRRDLCKSSYHGTSIDYYWRRYDIYCKIFLWHENA